MQKNKMKSKQKSGSGSESGSESSSDEEEQKPNRGSKIQTKQKISDVGLPAHLCIKPDGSAKEGPRKPDTIFCASKASTPPPAEEPTRTVYKVTTKYNNTLLPAAYDSAIELDSKNADCYSRRYTDLNQTAADIHFKEFGENDGRTWACGKNLTIYESQEYLWRHPDLQHIVGGAFGD